MLKTLTKTVLLACISLGSFAQDISHATEPNHLGLAGTGICLSSPFALGHNPALLSQSSDLDLASSISNKYGIKGLNYIIVEGHKKIKNKGFGIRIEQINTKHYSRTTSSLGLGIPLNSKLLIGVSLTNTITKITESNTSLALFYHIGINYHPKENISVAAAWKSNSKEQHQLTLGCALTITEAFTLIAEHLNNSNTTSWKIANIYKFNNTISLLSGFDLQHRSFHFGLNLQTNSINILFGFGFGQTLGIDSATGLSYKND